MSQGRIVLSAASPEDFAEFAARSDLTPAKPPCRMIAVAGKMGGRVIGIGGVAMWPNGVAQAFADFGPEARECPLTLHKAGLAVVELARRHGLRQLRAVAAEPKIAAIRWLVRLGFEPVQIGDETNYVLNL